MPCSPYSFAWLLLPLTYSSYLSGAKMKVLRPELAELKKKHGDDQQAYAVDQMRIFREAGVNPLGGCIPALLQIPIFFALYSFFSSNILLRGQSFLWANDLSTYDVYCQVAVQRAIQLWRSHQLVYPYGSNHQLCYCLLQHEHDARPEQSCHEVYAVYFSVCAPVYLQQVAGGAYLVLYRVQCYYAWYPVCDSKLYHQPR